MLMFIDWGAFWSGLIGTTVPAFVVSVILLVLNHKANKAVENHRNSLAAKLTLMESQLDKRAAMFSVWHQKRVNALVEIYEAFRLYLDFLRRALYMQRADLSLDPMWDFRTSVEKNIVFLDDALQNEINRFQGELLLFWNWASDQHSSHGEEGMRAVQHRLDYEIPTYLEKLRKVINSYADPADKRPSNHSNQV